MNKMNLTTAKTGYITAGILLLILGLLSLTPIFGQATSATVEFTITDDTLTININSPTSVEKFQVAVNTSKGYTISQGDSKLAGFMSGATALALTDAPDFNQYRWFSLDSPGGQQGSVQVPISTLGATVKLLLVRVDLQDSAGRPIPIEGALPKEALQTITTTATTTVTTTQVRTTTSTARETTTATVTTTQPAQTITQTVTAAPQTTTITTTTRATTTVQVPGPEPLLTTTGIAAIIVLIIIIIALVVLGMRRAGRV